MDNDLMEYFFESDGSDSDTDLGPIMQATSDANALFTHNDVAVTAVELVGPAFELILSKNVHVEKIMPMYTEHEFLQVFHMQKQHVKNLISLFGETESFKKRSEHGKFQSISAEMHILAFLWYVGSKERYRHIATRFNVAVSSIHEVVGRVLDFILTLAPETIKWPTISEQQKTASFFKEKYGLPNIIGRIDGVHFCIGKPFADSKLYHNIEGYHSLHMQAIVNEALKFLDVFIGSPGSVHDARVFQKSPISATLSNMCDFDYFLIGDNAYPCLPNLIVPYRDYGNLTRLQSELNMRLQQCLDHTEEAIRRLKQRFPQLKQLKVKDISRSVKIIHACCVLHNMSSLDDFQILDSPNELTAQEFRNPEDMSIAVKSSISGINKRDKLSRACEADVIDFVI